MPCCCPRHQRSDRRREEESYQRRFKEGQSTKVCHGAAKQTLTLSRRLAGGRGSWGSLTPTGQRPKRATRPRAAPHVSRLGTSRARHSLTRRQHHLLMLLLLPAASHARHTRPRPTVGPECLALHISPSARSLASPLAAGPSFDAALTPPPHSPAGTSTAMRAHRTFV